MFLLKIKVGLSDTDATGVLFFPCQFKLAMTTFEAFLEAQGVPIANWLQGPYLFPVVHAEADYQVPLFAGDALEIALKAERVGTTSVTFLYTLKKASQVVGTAKLTHVLVDAKTREKTALPDNIRQLFGARGCSHEKT